MGLKVRLALFYSLSVFTILIVLAFSLYYLNENFRKEEFVKRLLTEAKKNGKDFFKSKAGDLNASKSLETNLQHSLKDEQFFVVNGARATLYASPNNILPTISANEFELSIKEPYVFFENAAHEGIIAHESIRGTEYYLIVSAIDLYGKRKTQNLKLLLVLSVVSGMVFSGLLAFFYAQQAMKPLDALKKQLDAINGQNLTERIELKNVDDELWQIGQKFNDMLDRLRLAFDQQKSFVQLASHELRTPLANMLSYTEAALSKSLSSEDYRNVLSSLMEDQVDLIELTNALLILSRYEKMQAVHDPSFFRIDEAIYQAIDLVKQSWTKAQITIEFDPEPKSEEDVIMNGSEPLIKSALLNLIKNALQYSDDQRMKIVITAKETLVQVCIENSGKQLSKDDQAKLFIPFFRGENSVYKKGFGLGLALVKRIVEVHKGTIRYEALGAKLNRFIMDIPKE